MFVKLFTQILDSSIADNRPLRHFFTDLLLCADCKGYVIMTPSAIARRIGATLQEVEWGLSELQKPDPLSKTTEEDGRRIKPLEAAGYGWQILNYEMYRALKDADQMREATRNRVKRFREKRRGKEHADQGQDVTPKVTNVTHVTRDVTPCNANTEAEAEVQKEKDAGAQGGDSLEIGKTITSQPEPKPEPYDPGYYPDPSEYPSLETVRAWAEAIQVDQDIADLWHGARCFSGWIYQDKPMPTDISRLRAFFAPWARTKQLARVKIAEAQKSRSNWPKTQQLDRNAHMVKPTPLTEAEQEIVRQIEAGEFKDRF